MSNADNRTIFTEPRPGMSRLRFVVAVPNGHFFDETILDKLLFPYLKTFCIVPHRQSPASTISESSLSIRIL